MLDCGRNYKYKYSRIVCGTYNLVDDENHRINECLRFKNRNLCMSVLKYDFGDIYSDDEDTVIRTIEVIRLLWNLENGQNE